jgi:hypothetical protein
MNSIVKLSMFVFAAAAMITASQSANAAGSQAAAVLASSLGAHRLACFTKSVPESFLIGVRDGQVVAKAQDSGTVKYSVYAAKVNSSNVIIELTNDVDGPHTANVIILPLASLKRIANGEINAFQAFEVYREDWDGTSQNYKLICGVQ